MNDIRKIVERLGKAEERIARERGDFVLFAVLYREDSLFDQWDVAFSAPWADSIPGLDAYGIMDRELKKDLPLEDFLSFARYVVVPTDSDVLEELAEEHPVEHGRVIVRNREFGEHDIRKGYLITCRPPLRKVA